MKSAKILVIDDEKCMRELVKDILTEEGMEVFEAANERDSFKVLKKKKINLVILDLMLEDTDGLEILKKIRAFPLDLPVIIVSSKKKLHNKILGLTLDADDYITKPFDEGELIARIITHLRRYMGLKNYQKLVNEPIISQGLRLDLKSYQVYKNDKEIKLSAKCIKILQLFMENPNRVFTKEQIYDKIWDDTYYDENTIMVYICELRKKIEEPSGKHKLIQTIRGIGYKFMA